MKKLMSVILCICMLAGVCGCANQKGNVGDSTDDTSSGMNQEPLTLVSQNRSEYVVIYDGEDDDAKTFVGELVSMIYSATGVLIQTVDIDVSSKTYENEIIVGNARDTVADVVSSAADEDFIVAVSGNDLVLWASDAAMYTCMTYYLKNDLLAVNSENAIVLDRQLSVTYSQGDVDFSFLTLFLNGRTDYVIVLDFSNEMLSEYVSSFIQKVYSKFGVLIPSRDADESTAEHEIVVGDVREGVAELATEKGLSAENDFLITVRDNDLILYATDERAYAYLFEYFAHEMISSSNGETLVIPSGNDMLYSKSRFQDMSYVQYYQSIYGTYSSQVDYFIDAHFRNADKEDVRLVRALVERLADGFAVMGGSSSALLDGRIVKLDPIDYSRVTVSTADSVKIPAAFAKSYFGVSVPIDSTGYLDLTAYCNANGYHLYTDPESNISVVMPADGVAFGQSGTSGGYTDAAYLERMELFFSNPYSPEPQNNTEQSRVEIERDDACYDVANILDYERATFNIYFDPTILSVREDDGSVTLYSAFGDTSYVKGTNQGTSLAFEKSEDNGATWERIATIRGYSVPSMFEHNGYIYIMGGFADVQITRYSRETGEIQSVKFTDIDPGSGGPGTVLIRNGRVYKSYADVVISADLNSNLMASGSWTVSTTVSSLYNNPDWRREVGFIEEIDANPGIDWEEGSVIPGKDGNLYVTYRSNRQIGTLLLFQLSEDGKTLSYVTECNGTVLSKKSLVETPSSVSRPAIHYDESTGLYISLMCLYMGDSSTDYFFADYLQRAVLGFVVSEDLVNWTVVDTLLVDRMMLGKLESITAHGFQYVDFVIEGEDLLFVVRENSGERTVRYCHDAPCVTFYRLSDYRQLLKDNQIIES